MDTEIIRTRDPCIIQQCDVVVDVGAEYDPLKHRYDHHQRTFNDTFSTALSSASSPKTTKLSSAGLVYKHFGKKIIHHLYESMPSQDLDSVYFRVYEILIEEFDAIDNGINPTTEPPRFVTGTSSIFSQIGRLNHIKGAPLKTADQEYAQFLKAMDLCRALFLDVLQDIVYNWLPAKIIVENSLQERKGPILVLKSQCSWKDHLFNLEGATETPLLYVLYQKENDGMWMAQAISTRPDSFECRLPFPEPWRGLRDKELEAATNIPDGVFVHASGFLAGARSFEAANQLATVSVMLQQATNQ